MIFEEILEEDLRVKLCGRYNTQDPFEQCRQAYDLGGVVCFLDFSELGFLVPHRCLLSETSSLG